MIQFIEKKVQVPKEASELVDLLVVIAEDIKQKKSVTQVLTDVIPRIGTAVEGFGNLKEEVKDASIYALGGLAIGAIVAVFAKQVLVADVAPVEKIEGQV